MKDYTSYQLKLPIDLSYAIDFLIPSFLSEKSWISWISRNISLHKHVLPAGHVMTR